MAKRNWKVLFSQYSGMEKKALKFRARSTFSWGHPLNDYRKHIENMARLKMNQLILWNDNVPLNANDIKIIRPIWKIFQADWVRYGKYAHRISNFILEKTGGNVNMNLVGTLSGVIWMPFAVTAQLFWDCTEDFDKPLHRVMKRHYVKTA